MARGLVKGAVAGVFVSGLLTGILSELAPLPLMVNRPHTTNVTVPHGSGFGRPKPETAPMLPAPDTPPPSHSAQTVPDPGPSPTPPVAETAPTARPSGIAESAPIPETAPKLGDAAPHITTAPESLAPRAKVPPRAATESVQPRDVAFSAPQAPAAPDAGLSPMPTPGAGVPVASGSAMPAPSANTAPPQAPATLVASGTLTDGAPLAPAPGTAPVTPRAEGDGATAPSAAPQPPAAPLAPNTPTIDSGPAVLPPGMPGIGTNLPRATRLPGLSGAPQPGLGAADAPKPGFGTDVKGVTLGRLPTIAPPKIKDIPAADAGAAAPVPAAPKPAFLPAPDGKVAAPAPASAPQADTSAAPPVERYAAAFDAPPGKPLLSVILIDTGAPGLDRAAFAAMSMPVSFAIDPTMPDAAQAAAIYRKSGHEVLILGGAIPVEASASDLERLFGNYLRAVPQSVGLVDAATGGFADNHQLSQRVVGLLSDMGLGLVTYARGLDAADQIAHSQNLPAARIYRDLDADDTNARSIRRFLDRAAFKAAQEGRIVVIARTRPETLEGLKSWAGDSRARKVAAAPLTAALQP